MSVEINYLAVILAGLVSMPIGFIWYMPQVFGNAWMKGARLKPKDLEGGPLPYLLSFLASLLTAFILAHMTFIMNHFYQNSWLQDSLMTAFLLWLGIAFTRMTVHMLYERRRPVDFAIAHGYELVTIMAMGLIIGLLK